MGPDKQPDTVDAAVVQGKQVFEMHKMKNVRR
jgi:hypothetical protein